MGPCIIAGWGSILENKKNIIFILDNILGGQYLSGISRILAKEKIRYHSFAFARRLVEFVSEFCRQM